MRIGIERLARHMLDEAEGELTIGALAKKYDTTRERIGDALDVLKMHEGHPTTVPPVEWPEPAVCSVCSFRFRDVGH